MINLTREEAQQVLDALKNSRATGKLDDQAWGLATQEIETLRAKLSEPEQEPVAYGVLDDDGQIDWTVEYPFSNEPGWPDSVPLYTAPPQRVWQGLTEEDFSAIDQSCSTKLQAATSAESILKEKNT